MVGGELEGNSHRPLCLLPMAADRVLPSHLGPCKRVTWITSKAMPQVMDPLAESGLGRILREGTLLTPWTSIQEVCGHGYRKRTRLALVVKYETRGLLGGGLVPTTRADPAKSAAKASDGWSAHACS